MDSDTIYYIATYGGGALGIILALFGHKIIKYFKGLKHARKEGMSGQA